MTDHEIRFTISAELAAEVEVVSAEMGLSIEEIASHAFQGYMDGVREARSLDLDDDEDVARLPGAADDSVPLSGDEPWLSTTS